jgi:TldD protein
LGADIGEFVQAAKVDFLDVRYEVKSETVVHFSGRDLKEIGENATDGYVVRVFNKGGMADLTVTDERDLEKAVELATDAANLIAKRAEKKMRLADAPPVKGCVRPKLDGDPGKASIEDKLELVKHYNDIVLGMPGISTTEMEYFEVCRQKRYVSSEGADIHQELVTVGIGGSIIAKRGPLVQNVRVAVGGADGTRRLRDRDGVFEDKARIARGLLTARAVKGGKYDILLNPGMAGVFAHEAFGHFSEADSIEHNKAFRERMRIGTKLGSRHVTIIADSTMPKTLGFYKYDDEGMAVRPVELMKKGVLTGRLHSRRTAAEFDEPISGHCVAEDYNFAPIIRMGTIFIKPGDRKFDELLEDVRDGLYLCDPKGGQTTGDNFTFGTQYGHLIEDGRLGAMVRDTNVIGNLFTTLANIRAVGSDFKLSERGGCGKGAQTNIKSAHGGPHMAVKDMVVGGI